MSRPGASHPPAVVRLLPAYASLYVASDLEFAPALYVMCVTVIA